MGFRLQLTVCVQVCVQRLKLKRHPVVSLSEPKVERYYIFCLLFYFPSFAFFIFTNSIEKYK